MANIAVVGAGVMGLSSAVAIQRALPNARVTIMADKFTTDTTSDGAGGLFVPYAVDTDKDILRKWAVEGRRHFYHLAFSEHSRVTGVYLSHGYDLSTVPLTEPHPHLDFVLSRRRMNAEEISTFQPYYVDGYHVVTVIVEGRKYLPWLTARFQEKGGLIATRKIHSFDELEGKYDVVVNCAGLGSQTLTGDEQLKPERGQILRVYAPWIKFFIHANDNFYFFPSSENAAIGGTRQLDRYDVTPDASDTEAIWEKAVKRLPSVKGAKRLWEWAGLRPHRGPPRIVHNYGHGYYGISLSWGTGVHVAEMVDDLLKAGPKL
ncbi:hypothetical protein BaRGS_00008093 [Batillaria attramentaria]|uniref:FAD dependent oxidoreductase domain-containing protein n=1 Tax=Batillaria attramentaria TaxID=370345 RepID=A0ABD0LMU1_9CAEN